MSNFAAGFPSAASVLLGTTGIWLLLLITADEDVASTAQQLVRGLGGVALVGIAVSFSRFARRAWDKGRR